jgi:acyl-CoA thioester hydrolase
MPFRELSAEETQVFRHRTRIPIRYGDIDMLQHVNNAVYLTYMEQSRIQYAFDVLGWDGDWRALDMILAHTDLDFGAPIFLTDTLWLYSRVARLGTKSYEFEYRFVREHTDGRMEVTTTGRAVIVAFDVRTQQSMAIPDSHRARILAYEPGLGG